MAKIDVSVPDIGDFKDVPVIEVLVKPGDVVKVDQSLVTLESDKATMDVPSPIAGTVADVVTKVGDKVSMGVLIARIDAEDREAAPAGASAAALAKVEAAPAAAGAAAAAAARRRRRPRPRRPRPRKSRPPRLRRPALRSRISPASSPGRRCVASPANSISI